MCSLIWNISGGASSSSFLKSVGSLFEEGSHSAKILREGLRVVVGRGNRARLWNDITVDGAPLKEAFPRIFALAGSKAGYVCDYGSWSGSVWSWDIALRRACFDWELEQWELFRNSIESIQISECIPATIGWSFCPDGQFSIKSFRKGLNSGQVGDPSVSRVFGRDSVLLR
ncbi:hypothetical protein Dsin_002869 [Dipteronia sinensis]|uniref:Uncharacterized protein n=1 Tax=Dipteronia sinensis TaxID=43782 RepID=A0AAE0B7W7_9ROSI|nr:hypothetical protein Dsin_002869 [Dipteronia sinensis]